MAKKKVYAVRKGYTIGIFNSWEECKKNIDGFSGAEYKSYSTIEEAQAYIDGVDIAAKHVEQAADQNTVIAYVDGSFDADKRVYSFGCVLITPEMEIIKEYNCGNKEEALPSRNVAGELAGAMYAIKWTVEHGFKSIIIRHDYEGLSKWFSGEWKANSFVAIEYIEFLRTYKGLINISFEKITAHTNDKYNEEADRLATAGLTLKRRKKINSGANWFTVQGITLDEINTIFEILTEEMDGLLVKSESDGSKTMIYANRGKDRLTIQFFETGRTVIQGKPRNIFHSFVSYITQLLNAEEITPILNSCFKVTIDKRQIEQQYDVFLPDIPDTIDGKLKNSLLQSIYNLNYSGDMFDFTFLLHPVLRALEGHLRYILCDHNIPLDGDRFTCFDKSNNLYELKSEHHSLLPNPDHVIYLNDMYNHYSNNRHTLFHWDTPLGNIDQTRVINSKSEADTMIKETLKLINHYYLLAR